MKTQMLLRWLAPALILAASIPTYAQERKGGGGSSVGGGGDVVILPDDRVVLADPFIKMSGNRFELHETLKAELRRIDKLLAVYGASPSIIEEIALSPFVDYIFVEKLPENCPRVALGELPTGSHSAPVACTLKDGRTMIREDLFREMWVREQAKLIVHERLHAVKADIADDYLHDIAVGIQVALDLFNDQVNGIRRVPEKHELEALGLLRLRTVQAGLRKDLKPMADVQDYQSHKVHPLGGGIVHVDAKVSKDAFVGVGSYVGINSNLEGNAALLGAISCRVKCVLADQSEILDSQINGEVYLGAHSRILGSTLNGKGIPNGYNRLMAGEHVIFQDSVTESLDLGSNVKVVSSEIGAGVLASGTVVTESKLQVVKTLGAARIHQTTMLVPAGKQTDVRLWLHEGASLLSSTITPGYGYYTMPKIVLEEGSTVEDLNAQFSWVPKVFFGNQSDVTIVKGAYIRSDDKPICPEAYYVKVKSLDVRSVQDLKKECDRPYY